MMNAVEQVHIPEKLFYRINEVSTITQIKPYVLRYWETEFPSLSPEKDENDQRRYRKGDIEQILEIKRLLYTEKFTIAGARKQLRGRGQQSQPQAQSPVVEEPQQTGPVAVERTAEPIQPMEMTSSRRRISPDKASQLSERLSELRRDVNELRNLLG